MENVNEALKLIAQALEALNSIIECAEPDSASDGIARATNILEQAVDKLAVSSST